MSAGAHDGQVGIMLCLSCHDGNLATNGMMKGTTVETVPGGNTGKAPTLLGNDGTVAGNYGNDHPVGPLAIVGCGTTYTWDCVANANGTVSMTGPKSAAFKANYGFTVALSAQGANATVTCMSCHDQHSMNAYNGTIATVKGTYKTMFFIKGYYDPSQGNSTAQFCRQCHGGEGNEMHNALTIPTV
jgi:cytochrome c553